MKNSNKDFSVAGQSATKAKPSQKHDANLRKNSSLYFQIGLILCLLATYALFEMQFEERKLRLNHDTATTEPVTIDVVPPFQVESIKPQVVKSAPTPDLNDDLKVVEDDQPIVDQVIDLPDAKTTDVETPIDIDDVPEIEKPSEPLVVDFVAVESVPVYPGCEKYASNNERRACMSEKISKLLNRKFNTSIGASYGMSGKQRIFTQFTIDKNGNVTDIKTRGPHPALEHEADRVIHKIPKMKPGIQGNKPVGVVYSLPIIYQIRN
ncbi:energy transducer TonB [Winogradskyella rapida]|uniref:Energy transducer TonB n=1 Tax=Winogradskyella rapida TaxID=549701 RepID=A0ABW3KUK2_9FLAO